MMQFTPELIADSVVTFAGLLGLVLLAQVLCAEHPRTTVTRRFLFVIQLAAILLAVRLSQWLTGLEWIGRFTYIFAGLVPLAMLLLVEVLLRRHAPLVMKIWVAGGAVLLVFFGLLGNPDYAFVALTALAVYQVVAFVGMAIIVYTRDRDSQSAAENASIERLGLSLFLIVPFALTDFRTGFLDLPVRLSGIAILAMCWLGLTLRRGEASQSEIMYSLAAFAGALLFAALCISHLAGIAPRTTVQIMAVIISVGLLALVFNQARLIQRGDKVARVLNVLADTKLNSLDTFLNALRTEALTSGALLLDDRNLEDFDEAFQAQFDGHPIVCSEKLEGIDSPNVVEQFHWFFQKFGASHAMLVSRTPFQIMALNVPTLAQTGQFEQELRIAQRIAIMLAEKETVGVDISL